MLQKSVTGEADTVEELHARFLRLAVSAPADTINTALADLRAAQRAAAQSAQNSGRDVPSVDAPIDLDLRRTRHGIIADEENVRRILLSDPHLRGIARFDEFASELILERHIDVADNRGVPRLWGDADTVALQTYMQRSIVPRIGRDKIEAVLDMVAREHYSYHPIRDYLSRLTWDGKQRLNSWLADYLGAKVQPAPYLAAVGSAWLISAVARVERPGCQADSALVLEGAQGTSKSSALRVLAGDAYFSDSLPADLTHKDARDHLRGKWIIELPELAQFRRTVVESLKAFISRRHEQYRPAYGHREVTFARQCVFAGTTNDESYLVDTTGNRRFWVVACGTIELHALASDRDQLWAEATARYRAGDPWHLEGELAALAADEAAMRVAHDPWTTVVADILDTPRFALLRDITPGEVLAEMEIPQTERHTRSAVRIGQILRDLGWAKASKRHRTRGQIYTRRVQP